MNFKTYQDLRNWSQDQINEFPFICIIAFSQEKFDKELEKHNVKAEDLIHIAGGMFIRKTDLQKYELMQDEINTAIENFKTDDDKLKEAIKYEMANHEFCITFNYKPVFDQLNVDADELASKRFQIVLNKAEKEYLQEALEEGRV